MRRPIEFVPVRAIPAILLAVHAGLLLIAIRKTFITVDEVMNIAAGVSYWETGHFFVYRVNPPLTKMLAALPVLAARPNTDFEDLRDITTKRMEIEAASAFIGLNRTRIFDLVCLARLVGIAWSVLGAWLIYRWTRALYGGNAGILSLGLWCFDPYVLGHAGLVTTDVPAAVAGLAASYAFWRYLRVPTWNRAVVAGAILGVAESTKFTLLIFFPLWPAIWVVDRLNSRTSLRTTNDRTGFLQIIVILALGLEVINLGYWSQGSFMKLGDYIFISKLFSCNENIEHGQVQAPGNRFRGTWLGCIPVPFPEDFLRGIDVQRVDFEGGKPSYLAGTWQHRGWWYFYLYALAVKLPLGTLFLMLWGVAWTIGGGGEHSDRVSKCLLLTTAATMFAFVSAQTGYTQHSRYVLPVLPYLMINAAQLVRIGSARIRALVLGLFLTSVGSSLAAYPHSLSYFNEFVGGPSRGPDHLLDSNIDWGQDLLYLKDWLDQHPEAHPLRLAYYNFLVDPELVGISFELPPPSPGCSRAESLDKHRGVGPLPGYYAVSVNFLMGYVFLAPDGTGSFYGVEPQEFAYFQEFRPIAMAGFSIYIYNITLGEANRVRKKLGLAELRETIGQ